MHRHRSHGHRLGLGSPIPVLCGDSLPCAHGLVCFRLHFVCQARVNRLRLCQIDPSHSLRMNDAACEAAAAGGRAELPDSDMALVPYRHESCSASIHAGTGRKVRPRRSGPAVRYGVDAGKTFGGPKAGSGAA